MEKINRDILSVRNRGEEKSISGLSLKEKQINIIGLKKGLVFVSKEKAVKSEDELVYQYV